MDMSKHGKKKLLHCPKCNSEFPAQGRERYVQIVETVRANQGQVCDILLSLDAGDGVAKWTLKEMHKSDRDALLQPGGILTDAQIELLKE